MSSKSMNTGHRNPRKKNQSFRRGGETVNMLIVGTTGTGKSYFLKELNKSLIRPNDTVVWISNSQKDIMLPDILEVNRSDINYSLLLEKYPHAGIIYGMVTKDELKEHIDSLSQAVWINARKKRGKTWIIIDEASEFYPRNSHSTMLEKLIRGGRKDGISVIMSTQMIVDLDLSFLKQASYLVTFAVNEANDKEKVSKNIGIPSEYFLELNRQNHIYFVKNMSTGDILRGYEDAPHSKKRGVSE